MPDRVREALRARGLDWPSPIEHHARLGSTSDRLKEKAVSSPTYEAVSKPIYSSAIGRWKNYQKYLEPCLEVLQPCIEDFGY